MTGSRRHRRRGTTPKESPWRGRLAISVTVNAASPGDPEAVVQRLAEIASQNASVAITRAVLLNRDPGVAMPLPPDCARLHRSSWRHAERP
jgi:hypothetical protein